MKTIESFHGLQFLSDEVYVITNNDHPSFANGYGKGDLVRLIGPKKNVGQHFHSDYLTVCSVKSQTGEFCGIKKDCLIQLNYEMD